MYIEKVGKYTAADNTEHVSRGWFLLLMQPDLGGWDGLMRGGKEPVRALLRKVALEQCGQFAMGTARVAGHSLTISGSYGSDGLPMHVPPAVYALGLELPEVLYQMWSKGGGWNGAGSEAPAMRRWARANWDKLVPEYARKKRPYANRRWPDGAIPLCTSDDVTKARVYYHLGLGRKNQVAVDRYDSDAAAYAAWLSWPLGGKAAFRAADDTTPVEPGDLV